MRNESGMFPDSSMPIEGNSEKDILLGKIDALEGEKSKLQVEVSLLRTLIEIQKQTSLF